MLAAIFKNRCGWPTKGTCRSGPIGHPQCPARSETDTFSRKSGSNQQLCRYLRWQCRPEENTEWNFHRRYGWLHPWSTRRWHGSGFPETLTCHGSAITAKVFASWKCDTDRWKSQWSNFSSKWSTAINCNRPNELPSLKGQAYFPFPECYIKANKETQMSKTILITGSSSGIGRATAKLFHDKGWNVIATMRAPEKEAELTNLDNVTVK